MYGANATGLIELIIVWIILCSLPFALLGFGAFWIVRRLQKNKKVQAQERSQTEEMRCLSCGAVIDKTRQACQVCG
jgi:uncharacterized protein YneF (UPF0154 family)